MRKFHWLLAVVPGLVSGLVLAAGEAGTIKLVRGTVHIDREGQRLPVAVGDPVRGSDTLRTGADGMVGLSLRDNTRLSAGPDSVLSLDAYAFDATTHAGELKASVKKGTVAVISGKLAASSPETVQFRTATTTLGVRGTEFVIEAADRGDN